MRKQYHELTKKQLYKRLERRGYPLGTINALIQRAQEKRKYLNKVARLRYKTSEPWGVLINGMLAEMNTTRAKLAHYKKNELYSHYSLYENYLKVMQRLLPLFRAYERQGELLPIQAAEHQKYEVANEAKHWADWVPRKIKLAFAQEQQQLPTNPHARNRAPLFSVKDYSTTRRVRRTKHVNAWREERAMFDAHNHRATLDNRPNEIAYTQAILDGIDKATRLAEGIPLHEALPKAWESLLSAEEREEITRLGEAVIVRQ